MNVLSKGGVTHAIQRRTPGLPGSHDRSTHWKQMEAADPAQPAGTPVEVQRDAALHPGHPGISQKVLTDNLRALENDGIITRTVFPEVPPRVEYALSELGDSMRPIIDAMQAWGLNYQRLVREAE